MKNTTKQALAAILAADETVDQRLALEALATLERGGAAPPEDRTLTEEQVAERLGGITGRSVRRLRVAGAIRPIYGTGDGHRCIGYSEASVRAYLERGSVA